MDATPLLARIARALAARDLAILEILEKAREEASQPKESSRRRPRS